MARIVQVEEIGEEIGSGADRGRRPLWINVDHVVLLRAHGSGATELSLTTGERVRIAGEPRGHIAKLGLPLGRVMGAGV